VLKSNTLISFSRGLSKPARLDHIRAEKVGENAKEEKDDGNTNAE